MEKAWIPSSRIIYTMFKFDKNEYQLFVFKDAEKFLKETTLHELAHAINKIYFGRCHDAQWKYICKLMNRSSNIYHNYRTPENKPVRKHANFIPNL